MDYRQIYADFIADRKGRGCPAGYSEKHHITPRSLGGSDAPENLIRLTAREHYFAHCCLAKIYGGGMWVALDLMGRTQKAQHGAARFCMGRLFAIARSEAAKSRSEGMTGAWASGAFTRNRTYGPATEETRAKVSAALLGRKLSPESITKRTSVIQARAQRFTFVELATGQRFVGTALEFRRRSGVTQSHVSLLTSGKAEVAKGWVLAGNEHKPRGNRDHTVRVFKHKDGRVFEGTAYDFNRAHIQDSGMLSNCINGKNGVKTARGWTHAGEKEVS